jgi:hypothetical protein
MSQPPAQSTKETVMPKSSSQTQIVTAFKGFDTNLKCRDFQYEVGQSYEHEGPVAACSSGFHACEYALDVFAYYPAGESRFCSVELTGEISRDGSDSKVASAKLKVVAEIGIPGIVTAAVNWIMRQIDVSKKQTLVSGDSSAATNTGDRSAATNTGDSSAATNTGYRSAATVDGKDSLAIATGHSGRARACAGSAIVLCFRDDDYRLVHVFSSKVGENGIEPDVFYKLDENGVPQKVETSEVTTP